MYCPRANKETVFTILYIPAARLFLQQTLVSTGTLSVSGRMRRGDMEQVRSIIATYTPAVPEFFPLYGSRRMVEVAPEIRTVG
jgi:hypothetical protein